MLLKGREDPESVFRIFVTGALGAAERKDGPFFRWFYRGRNIED